MNSKKSSIHALAEAVGPFSRAIRVDNLLFISGTSALSHIPGKLETRLVEGDIEAQTTVTLNNIKAVVEAAGGTMSDIVKITVMLRNPEDYSKMNEMRARFFATDPKPASSTFICGLTRKEMLVEMEAIAVLASPVL